MANKNEETSADSERLLRCSRSFARALIHARNAIRRPIQSSEAPPNFMMHLAHNLPPFILCITSKLKARLKSCQRSCMYVCACVCVCIYIHIGRFTTTPRGNDSRIKLWMKLANPGVPR